MVVQVLGSIGFGLVIGWVLRFVLAHAKEITVGSLSTIISAVGGAALTRLFDDSGILFGCYSLGLAAGFFVHVALFDIDPKTGTVRYRAAK